MKQETKKPEVVNHTKLTLAEIQALPRLGSYTNEWRQRVVTLYRRAPGQLISVGEGVNLTIICEETDQDHRYALSAWAAGNFNYMAK